MLLSFRRGPLLRAAGLETQPTAAFLTLSCLCTDGHCRCFTCHSLADVGSFERGGVRVNRMTKPWRAVAIVLAAVAAIVLCGWMAANWSRLRPYHWQIVESPDAAFSLSFPGNPAASQQSEIDVIDGSEFVSSRLAVSPAPRIAYAVSWWVSQQQTSKSTEGLFAHFRDCDAKVFRGNVTAREFIVQGYPATEMTVVNSGGRVAFNRVIRAGPRIYSLWVVNTSGKFVVDKTNVSKFFDSFSLH